MKNIFLLLSCCMAIQNARAQAPVIVSATPVVTTVEQWGKFEILLDINANWTNPYNYDEIRVACTFTAPDGQTKSVDGFFMQPYTVTNEQTGTISPVGSGQFRVRFSPDQTGAWKYALSCTNNAGTGTFPEQTFTASAPAGPNKGFVRGDQTNYLFFDNNEQYIPLGENICWYGGNAYTDYKNWLGKLAAEGGNFFRVWQCHWGLGLEWKNNVAGFTGLRKYKQSSAFYTDWLLDFSAENGLYMMLCLQHHGQVSSDVNPNWDESPYNSANGGPCTNTWDFFTNTASKNHTKNRLRYIAARWGYSRNVMAWELFNEVDWTDDFANKKGAVADWHAEMAAYLVDKDPNHHLVTSSFAQDQYDFLVWDQPGINFTQTHYYVETPNLERVLVNGIRNYLDNYGKPTMNGEFGLTTSGTGLAALDPDGIHMHNCLWGSLFGGGMGAGATWWWDNYVEPKNLYHHFGPLAAVAPAIPFRSGNLSPAQATVTGVPADLVLTPTLGWSALADTFFTIDGSGVVTPVGANLSQYLYGSLFNTQYRRPPVFHIAQAMSGQFRVKTGAQAGALPKIAIWLDGIKVLEQNAQVNQTYQIDVPAGQHVIAVDNTGSDWISISSYTLTGLGSAVDAYVLKSPGLDKIAGWALNNRYNHASANAGGLPPAATGAVLHVQNVQNGDYLVRFYHCLTGALLSTEPVSIMGGVLNLNLPEITWDVAFFIDPQPVAVSEPARDIAFRAWPNPAAPGAMLTLDLDTAPDTPISVALLDMAGRPLQSLHSNAGFSAAPQVAVALPEYLPAGVYWIRVDSGDRVGVKAVAVGSGQ